MTAAASPTLADNPVAYATQPYPERWLLTLSALSASFWPQGHAQLLQALVLLHPQRAPRFALVAWVGVALGVTGGWLLGAASAQVVLPWLVPHVPALAQLQGVPGWLMILPGLPLAVLAALGFSPMPLCWLAWTAGLVGLPLPVAALGLAGGHGLKLLLHTWVLWRGGLRLVPWLARDWHGLTLVAALLGLILYLAIGYLIHMT